MTTPVNVNFSDWFQKGFDLYRDNLALFIPAALIAVVLSVVTLGILAGPMMVGLILITLARLDGQEAEIGDLFRGFHLFLPSFLFVLVWGVVLFIGTVILGVVPCLGQILGILYAYSLSTLVMFGPYLIAERKMEFWDASLVSINMIKQNFWPFLGFGIVAMIIGGIGAIACGIGVVVTLPIQYAVLAVAFRDLFGSGGSDLAEPAGDEEASDPNDPGAQTV